jgi:AP-2 complex subunit alpha
MVNLIQITFITKFLHRGSKLDSFVYFNIIQHVTLLLKLASNEDVLAVVSRVMKQILQTSVNSSKNVNQNNVIHAVLFEAMDYAIHMNHDSDMIPELCNGLLVLLDSPDTNLRYLALETLAHMASSGSPLKHILPYQSKIFGALRDQDISIRQRALDLLYCMCTETNSRNIISELLIYVKDANFEFQEEMVLKIAILAEKHVHEYTWYVDVILKLLKSAGNATTDTLWYRVIQIITNHKDLREYGCYTMLQAVKQVKCHEVTIKIAGHILGEYGHIIVESPGCSPIEQFRALNSKFNQSSATTRGVLLSTFLKFINLFPEIKGEILKVFESYTCALDIELQQRACEYLALAQLQDENMIQTICEEMPLFPEKESVLIKQLAQKLNDTQDNRTWSIDGALKPDGAQVHQQIVPEKGLISSIEHTSPSFENSESAIQNVAPSEETLFNMFSKLLISPNGVLYEDNTVQIGLKSQYSGNNGKFSLYFGNKSSLPIQNFNVPLIVCKSMKTVLVDPIITSIKVSEQICITYYVELDDIPDSAPVLGVTYDLGGKAQKIQVRLPIVVTKFIDVCELSSGDFYARWKQIGGPPKEAQTTLTPKYGVDIEIAKRHVIGLSFTSLDGVDPSPKNHCFAGIFTSTSTGKVGCLIRVESNLEHQVIFH